MSACTNMLTELCGPQHEMEFAEARVVSLPAQVFDIKSNVRRKPLFRFSFASIRSNGLLSIKRPLQSTLSEPSVASPPYNCGCPEGLGSDKPQPTKPGMRNRKSNHDSFSRELQRILRSQIKSRLAALPRTVSVRDKSKSEEEPPNADHRVTKNNVRDATKHNRLGHDNMQVGPAE